MPSCSYHDISTLAFAKKAGYPHGHTLAVSLSGLVQPFFDPPQQEGIGTFLAHGGLFAIKMAAERRWIVVGRRDLASISERACHVTNMPEVVQTAAFLPEIGDLELEIQASYKILRW